MPGEIVVGAVAVDIVPSTRNLLPRLAREIAPAAAAAGKAAGEAIEKEVADGAADGVKKGLADGKRGAAKDGAEAGGEFAGGFAAAVRAGLKAAQSALGDFTVPVELQADLDGLARARVELNALKQEIKRIGDVEIDANLNDKTFMAKINALKGKLRELGKSNDDLGFQSELRNADKALDATVDKARGDLGSFATYVRGIAAEVAKSVTVRPELKGQDDVYDGLAEIRAVAKDIVMRIGIDLDDATAVTQLLVLDKLLDQVTEKRSVNLGVGADAANLATVFGKFRDQVDDADTGLTALGTRLQALATTAAGEIQFRMGIDDDGVYAEAARVKIELTNLATDIELGLDDAEALAQMVLLEVRLKELTRKRSIQIDVDRDVLNAGSVLSGVGEGLQQVAENATTAGKATEGFGSSLSKFTPAAAVANASVVGLFLALPFIIAVANTAILGLIGLITTLGAVAGVAFLGIGVLVAVFSKILPAIQATDKAAQEAGKTSQKSALDVAQAAQTAFSNQIALRNSTEAVASAEKALARARADSSKQFTQSARSLAGAQRNVVQANTKEKDARTKLSKAYVDAKQDLKELNDEIRKNRAEQEAQIVSINGAKNALNALAYDPTASGQQIAEAQAKVGQEQAKLRDLQNEQTKNLTQKSAYDTLGLAANPGVISAQAELKTAIESVADAQDAVKTAAENAADAQISAAQRVSDAEEALATARRSRAELLRQQQLAAAVAAATPTAADTAQTPVDEALAQLTETGKKFVTFYEKNIKPVMDSFFATAQDSGILDGIIAFFTAIKPILPPIKGLISTVSYQMGQLFGDIGKFLGSDAGKDFIGFLRQMVISLTPVLGSLLKSGLKIIFTLFEALAPTIEQMAPQLAQIVAQFADMFAEFTKSDDFQALMQQLIDNAPLLLEFVLKLALALIRLMVAITPYTDKIIALMIGVLDFFNSIPIDDVLMITEKLAILGAVVFVLLNAVAILAVGFVVAVGIVLLWVRRLFDKWLESFGGIGGIFSDTWDLVKTVFRGAADWLLLRWRTLTGALSGAWDYLFGDDGVVRGAFNGFIDWAKLAFKRCVDMIGSIWGGIKQVLAVPIVGVIALLNDGVVAPLNLVGKVFGFKIDPIQAPKWVQQTAIGKAGMATGGIVPGYQSSKRDEVLMPLRKGEGVLVPEVVRALGAGTIMDWNRRANLGQKIPGLAYGGLVDQIVSFERKSGVPFNVTSGVRDSNDYHGRGMAVDTASSADNMVRLASWLYGYSPYLLELIHSGGKGYFVKGGEKVGANSYRSVIDQHFSHVHTAMNQAGLNAVANGVEPADAPDDGSGGGLLGWALNKVRDVFKPLVGKFAEQFGNTDFAQWMAKIPEVLLGKFSPWLRNKASQLGSVVTDTLGDVSGFLKSLFTDEKPSAHEKGDMASPITAASYAKSQLKNFGWDSTDMEYLAKLWNGESGWRWNAKNPNSGAYGIPQSLPGTKMGSVGADWATNAFTQVLWGMGYIKDRYEDPTNAYLTWLGRTPHWYDTGGYLPPGLTLAYNGTGRNERVMTHDQEQDMMRERAALLQGGVDVNVRVHDHAVPGLVSVELDRQFGALADSYVYGVPQ